MNDSVRVATHFAGEDVRNDNDLGVVYQEQAKPNHTDALQTIKGVGPKLEALLHEIGVRTYEQIAAFPPDYIEELDDFLSFSGRIERDGWTAQAAQLATTRPAKTSALPPIPDEVPDNATARPDL